MITSSGARTGADDESPIGTPPVDIDAPGIRRTSTGPCRARRRRISKRAANNRASSCTVRRSARGRGREKSPSVQAVWAPHIRQLGRDRGARHPALRHRRLPRVAPLRPVRRRPAVARAAYPDAHRLVVDGTPAVAAAIAAMSICGLIVDVAWYAENAYQRAPRTGRTASIIATISSRRASASGPSSAITSAIICRNARRRRCRRRRRDPVLVVRAPAPRGKPQVEGPVEGVAVHVRGTAIAAKASRTDSRSSRSRAGRRPLRRAVQQDRCRSRLRNSSTNPTRCLDERRGGHQQLNLLSSFSSLRGGQVRGGV